MLTMSATTETLRENSCTLLTYSVFIYTVDEEKRNHLTLVDTNNESSTLVKKNFFHCSVKEIDIHVKKALEDIVQVKLEEGDSKWYCSHIEVKDPFGKCFVFPCYRWIGEKEVIIREGSARLPQDDTLFEKQRQKELESRREIFRWKKLRPGFPQSIDAKLKDLPLDVQFDKAKEREFNWNFLEVVVEAHLDEFIGCFQSWKDIADYEKIFRAIYKKNTALENVIHDWNTDYMFGYQFLNGCNPVMIRKCKKLPDKFPVTHEMVKGSLQRGLTLEEEIEAGNIYIADYEILNYLEANKTDKWQYYLTAPICLLYKNRLDQIVPIAIQLSQTPGKTSPIFLPTDNDYDWMLAKMWVKSSDFNLHELSTHLFKTHLISEVFEIAMYRQLSTVHPVYKLLIPHVRFTMAINAEARDKLIHEENGIYRKISSISADGINTLMKRAMKALNYKSLCFPEEIRARGMEDAPKYYYRDDGMRIWEAIKSFITDLVKIYYDSDEAVKKDVEIQAFVEDINSYCHCFTEFPQSLKTQAELIKYLTAVIFTGSAQHAAVNFGQYDWYGWIPNSPSCMRKPPPKQKGQVNLKYIMDTLPDSDCSRVVLGIVWTLSQFQRNELYLVTDKIYKHFTEQPVKEAIKTFQEKLGEVEDRIKCRNEKLPIPYGYLSPDKIPNSVAI
ncbi:polyunsaturated fatty acid 5-lipoxygenase-like [Misgurnus anguillicaudatus]|uniref:polyunsaturated fatty acid 5-lipoxygenase-like n=1 Tax=Misgurnus anguillicaudatus TaxID=75329 RepID=UPI003CCF897A